MNRRRFMDKARRLLLGSMAMGVAPDAATAATATTAPAARPRGIALFLCGDVMTGRGIDQVLPRPVEPTLHEPYVRSARDYVALAERASGRIPRPVAFDYVWGDALAEWARVRPDVRIANLETAVTTQDDWQRDKGIHYRMHPANVPCLTAAALDCCVLANNHVLDWGRGGLAETLASLHAAGVRSAGAGHDLAEAAAPAVLPVAGRGRVLVWAFGATSSGIPPAWAARPGQPGVNLLPDLSAATLRTIAAQVRAAKRPGDVAVAAVHWGENWGYAVPDEHRVFARGLVEQAGIDVVHGHSSHHPIGIEVVNGRLVLYGCGDFLNDYEGIAGHESYRGDLSLMYFAEVDPASGRLLRLTMTPMQIRHFRLNRASAADAGWLRETLDREGRALGTRVEAAEAGRFALRW